jgi:hypothetical protein
VSSHLIAELLVSAKDKTKRKARNVAHFEVEPF